VNSILVVDDETNMLVLLDRVLHNEGYTVHVANDGSLALELIAKHEFYAAILDVKMFPIDGVTLLGMIKDRVPTIHVVMITGYPTTETHDESMLKGAAAYLTKPLNIVEMKGVLRDLVGVNTATAD
jgi:DNA-binding NtrC family response regulator